jgi:hypothetical protein
MMQDIDMISKILMPVGLFFFGFVLNGMREDIKGIRADIGDAIRKIFDHVSDHAAHCKHPTTSKGC